MKVFVTGGSGFVGETVLQQLHAAGHSIRMLARAPVSSHAKNVAARFNGEIHPGDVVDAASLRGALRDIEAVIHLVGIISEVGDRTFENVHVHGTQNMVNAAQSAGTRRLVQMSALGTRPNAVSRYHQSKWAAEEIVRSSKLDFTIFRPSIIYGPKDHFVNLFAKLSKFSPVLPVMGNGQSKLQPVPVEEVATAFIRALNEPRAVGQTYDLCGPEELSFNEVLNAILRVTGRRRWKLHIPLSLAKMQAAFLEFVFAKLLRKPPPFSRDQLLMLQEDNVGNPEPAANLFGLAPIKFETGIARYL
jgi:uncharacterized protein YbjT (DUF2867 family)